MGQKFKILEEWFDLNEHTGTYVRYAKIKPFGNGGKEKIITLTFDRSPPFNALVSKNGYRAIES